jgi:hypothetical protein
MSYLLYESTYLPQNCALEGSGEIFPKILGKREISCNIYCLPWFVMLGKALCQDILP